MLRKLWLAMGTLLIAQVVSLPFYQWLSKKTSKPRSYIVGAVAFVAVSRGLRRCCARLRCWGVGMLA